MRLGIYDFYGIIDNVLLNVEDELDELEETGRDVETGNVLSGKGVSVEYSGDVGGSCMMTKDDAGVVMNSGDCEAVEAIEVDGTDNVSYGKTDVSDNYAIEGDIMMIRSLVAMTAICRALMV